MTIDGLTALASHGSSPGLPLEVLASLTLLSLAPFLLVMTTSFVRIVIVLSLVRSAIGANALPPNAVLTGLAFVLTLVVMTPTMQTISRQALDPYGKGKISQTVMAQRAFEPLRAFMLRQTRTKDIALFARVSHEPVADPRKASPTVLIPAFVVGELRNAFAIGFALYLPFTAIDLAVASILMGLGMFMLSPPIISLPCKLLLFVMVDGWALLCGSLVQSFR
jgi:flagellar biosynthetic protein FliP